MYHKYQLNIKADPQQEETGNAAYAEPHWLPERAFPGMKADKKLLQRMAAIVEANLSDQTFTVEKLAYESGFCRRHLHRKLQALTNQSPSRFITALRLQHAAVLIIHSSERISEIAYQSGFNTPNYFCKVFREAFGCSPKAYRENGQGQQALGIRQHWHIGKVAG